MLVEEKIKAANQEIPFYVFNTVIIGSGAAGLNCAEHLFDFGVKDIAIITDKLGGGTSNNSGSDKQTYYKLGIFGDIPDSPMDLAHTLFDGGMMHGDLAYIEAVCSAQEFYHLIRNGVPFPFNRYGAYVGYKTDHDPRQRATSAGPKTSMFMFKNSLKQVQKNATKIFDEHSVIALLTTGEKKNKKVIGALTINKKEIEKENFGLTAFCAQNVVLATGGPGEMYQTSVYPRKQIGSHGLALEIGAIANNLTESQYGLASISFRWNLSGTYQQVIPAYFSTDSTGQDRKNFLADYFSSTAKMATAIFLKGYQWPFHTSRLQNEGSSLVDIAVYNEIMQGRRVFMDFMHNPQPGVGMEPFALNNLEVEALSYLQRSGALQATPYERLAYMNKPSIEIYEEHNQDLRQPLEVAVCAQHNNGGLRGNIWWESNIKHLFPIGEVNGTHGVRPGGSALNSGQVGGLRAAQYIANVYNQPPDFVNDFPVLVHSQIEKYVHLLNQFQHNQKGVDNDSIRERIKNNMSREAAFIRNLEGINKILNEGRNMQKQIVSSGIKINNRKELVTAFENYHLVTTHLAFLETIKAYIERGGGSRGACMILDPKGSLTVKTKNGEMMPHRPENMAKRKEILETQVTANGKISVKSVPVRPLPEDNSWYENTWKECLEGKIFT